MSKSKVKAEHWIKIHKVLHSCKDFDQLEISYKWCKCYIKYLHGEVDFSLYRISKLYDDIDIMAKEYKKIKGELDGREVA
jgi:hypothetical protein